MYHRFKWTQVSRRRNWISREYEPLQPYYLQELARAVYATTFVDVGANIGLYSVFMSQTVSEVIAYEANDALATEVTDNFSINSINGTVRRVAVSNQTGTVNFGIVSRYAGNSAVVEEDTKSDDYGTVDSVEAVRLDDELATLLGPIAFKIDVEGHEMSVLEGSAEIFSKQQCVIQIENFDGAVDAFLSDLNFRKLTSIGPDAYFTNIKDVEPLDIYEKAASALIEANHEHKTMILSRGDIGLVISGKVYAFVRKIALKVMGRSL